LLISWSDFNKERQGTHIARKADHDDDNDEGSGDEREALVEDYHMNKMESRRSRTYDTAGKQVGHGILSTITSIGLWIGRPESAYSNMDLYTGLEPLRNVDSTAATIPIEGNGLKDRQIRLRRQNLLRDMKLLELLMHFNCIIYNLIYAETSRLNPDRLMHSSDEYISDLECRYRVPPLLKDCCRASYDLICLAVQENKTNASRLISISGVLLTLINHEGKL
jgi:hypothetical protein